MPLEYGAAITSGAHSVVEQLLKRKALEQELDMEARRQAEAERANRADETFRERDLKARQAAMQAEAEARQAEKMERSREQAGRQMERRLGRLAPDTGLDPETAYAARDLGIGDMVEWAPGTGPSQDITGASVPGQREGFRTFGVGETQRAQEAGIDQRAQAAREALQFEDLVSGLPARAQSAARLARGGVKGISAEDLQDPSERRAERVADITAETTARERVQQQFAPPRRDPSSAPMTAGQAFSAIGQLNRSVAKSSADADKIVNAYNVMQGSIARLKAGGLRTNDPAGQGVLVTFQKILDPTSVVRESEYGRSREGQPIADRVVAKWEQLTEGGPGVAVGALEEYVNLAGVFAKQAQAHRERKLKEARALGSAYGLDPQFITGSGPELLEPETFAPQTPGTTAPSPSGSRFTRIR